MVHIQLFWGFKYIQSTATLKMFSNLCFDAIK